MNKKSKKVLAASVGLATVGVVSGAVLAVGNYFVDYAILRPEPTAPQAGDDPLAPSFELSPKEQETKDYYKEKGAQWQKDFPPTVLERTSHDGLSLWTHQYRQPVPSHLWMIGVHGYLSSHTSVEDLGYEYFQRGYNVLTPDLRGHGNSEGDYVGMGLHDAQDIIHWVEVILQEDPQAEIVLHGQSMGAATVMIAAGMDSFPQNVFGVIEDCGYTNSYQMMVEQLNYRYNLPAFPIVPLANFMAEFRTNYDLKDANPEEYLKNATVPILFIHGDQDNFVQPYMHTQLFQGYQGPKLSMVVEGADHVASRNLEPERYFSTVFDFLDTHLQEHRENLPQNQE